MLCGALYHPQGRPLALFHHATSLIFIRHLICARRSLAQCSRSICGWGALTRSRPARPRSPEYPVPSLATWPAWPWAVAWVCAWQKKSPFLESGLHLCLSAERTICNVWVRSGGDEAPSHPSPPFILFASRHGHFDSEIATHAACTPLFSRQSKIGRVGNCSP